MLEPFGDDVWIASRPARFFGVETGSRMTIVKMPGGGLFVHSPVALDDATRRDVDALGEVRAVVAPSVFHHLHVAAWMAAYPRARFTACPGLDCKRPDLTFHAVLGDQPDPAWAGEIEQVFFSSRRENEVVFYVPHQKLFVCADALIHLSTHPNRMTRFCAWLMANDAPGTGYLERLMVRDKKVARRQVDRILAWEFDRAVLAHGAPLTRGAHEAMRHAYAWV